MDQRINEKLLVTCNNGISNTFDEFGSTKY